MILTIMLWLGMQGQAEATNDYLCSGGCMNNIERSAPSAEHVFEIRTKREDHGTAKDDRSHGLGVTPHCDDPEDVLESPNQCHEGACLSMYIPPHCVRVTRELWLDGKRIGIVKGLQP